MERFRKGKFITLFGYNGATATAQETLSPRSALITVQPTATAIQVSSTSASDVLTSGSGAWTVRVFGLDANFNEINEDLNLNGQTAVAGTKVFSRVNQFCVTAAGSGTSNAGELILSVTGAALTGGIPNTATDVISSMAINANIDWNLVYTVPLGKKYSLTQLQVFNRTQIDRIIPMIRPYGGIWYSLTSYEMSNISLSSFFYPKGSIVINEKEDFKVDVIAGTAGGFSSVIAILEEESSPSLRS